jgi:hypothetical protein
VHVDRLWGKVHAVPTRATNTAADAARIHVEMALCCVVTVSLTSWWTVVVDHDPKLTRASTLFRESTRSICSSLPVGHHRNTNARAERVSGVLGDTLRAMANGRTDDWGMWDDVAALRRPRH